MLKLFRFGVDFGRAGELNGLFLATQEAVDGLTDKEIYFGEVLGKHSEVTLVIEGEEFEVVTDVPSDIEVLQRVFDRPEGGTITGYNPLDYLEEE